MGSLLLWGLVAIFALVDLIDSGCGAESTDAVLETEDNPSKEGVETPRLSRTTWHQKHRPTVYRTGSLSALSRALMMNLAGSFAGTKWSGHQKGNATTDHCRGCCGTSNTTARTKPLGRREEGKGSQSSEGSPSRRPWGPARSQINRLPRGEKTDGPFSPEVPYSNITAEGEQQKAK
ncbi:uncharacterized protein LOC133365530 isoform X2 [Rhineura floridana]|uniref:uncharacterized protein LOC133365530 isoform X2 n=1 Tax=Rhineura floridana TaxID=261503 RepID=UPI002AC87317|nr:uncharacterized protein LOC133365530 isoform X2 [Rhineura floridana]